MGSGAGLYGRLMSLLIQDLPLQERPRERAVSHGLEALAVQELLAIILGRGSKSVTVTEISNSLIARYKSLGNLADVPLPELCLIKGLGGAKALQLKAAFELGKRWSTEENIKNNTSVLNSRSAFMLVKSYLRNKKKEHLMLFALDSRSRLLLKPQLISIGTLDASLVHPREVYGYALSVSASRILLAHNHPSGDPSPSTDDLNVTEALVQAGRLMKIELIDHIVVAEDSFYSIRESNSDLF
jgi:DNA repair protein RadC